MWQFQQGLLALQLVFDIILSFLFISLSKMNLVGERFCCKCEEIIIRNLLLVLFKYY